MCMYAYIMYMYMYTGANVHPRRNRFTILYNHSPSCADAPYYNYNNGCRLQRAQISWAGLISGSINWGRL